MNKFTLEELKYADEICNNERFLKLAKLYGLEDYYISFKWKKGLIEWIFTYSRRDFKNDGFGEKIEILIKDLIKPLKKYKNEK